MMVNHVRAVRLAGFIGGLWAGICICLATGRAETINGLLPHGGSGPAIVRSSPGGTGAAAMALAARPLVIDGPCLSACAWAFVTNPRACFTSRASFGFHGSADPGTGRPMPVADQYWLDRTPSALRQRIVGLTTHRVIYVSASEMASLMPGRQC